MSLYLQSKAKNRSKGMTLVEILVALSIGLLIMVSIYGIYIVSLKFNRRGMAQADLSQNSRITIESISRDLKATPEILTPLPASQIKFQDGSQTSKIQYFHYYLDANHNLHFEISHYSFQNSPATWVKWNATGGSGPLLSIVTFDQIKAQKINSISFTKISGTNFFQISLQASDGENNFSLQTNILGRNL